MNGNPTKLRIQCNLDDLGVQFLEYVLLENVFHLKKMIKDHQTSS